ncbi:hypothetical protein RND71_021728 [Anisodus tanguticus]|uniref:Uncharacterized protein n=1 Tax=Anisodus tanguticus TaxID=243964 RepID=A0AAE1VFH9_9SOLA|nr:hypothetical protein RND71_021728 [Anisodus tanguticus]
MHAYNRIPSSGHSSPSSPRSRSPRHRSKPAPRFPAPKTLPQRLSRLFLSLLLRRQRIFLFAPLIYVSAMLFYMGTDNVPPPHYAPGSIYRSPQLYARLRPEMDSDNSTADALLLKLDKLEADNPRSSCIATFGRRFMCWIKAWLKQSLELKPFRVHRSLACLLDNSV